MNNESPLSQLHILQQYYRVSVERDCMRSELERAKRATHGKDSEEVSLLKILGREMFGGEHNLIGLPRSQRNDLIVSRLRALDGAKERGDG